MKITIVGQTTLDEFADTYNLNVELRRGPSGHYTATFDRPVRIICSNTIQVANGWGTSMLIAVQKLAWNISNAVVEIDGHLQHVTTRDIAYPGPLPAPTERTA